jgi:hypothetical protein
MEARNGVMDTHQGEDESPQHRIEEVVILKTQRKREIKFTDREEKILRTPVLNMAQRNP